MPSPASTSPLPVTIEPGKPPMVFVDTDDPAQWVTEHREAVKSTVADHGGVHIRGLAFGDSGAVAAAANQLMDDLTTDTEAFAGRDEHPGGIYSSSAWPPKQQMCMHHELSYRLDVPGTMMFACLASPSEGGRIALADASTLLDALPADLVDRFEREGWMLVRNYTEDIGLSVAEAFGTDDRREVEDYCTRNAIDFEWLDDGELRTRQRRRAVVEHPATGRRCWFNQIAFLSEWTLNPEVRDFLVDMYGADGLPFNTRFGNGDVLEEEVVEIINGAYDSIAVSDALLDGDVLVIDNIRTAHSRDPYQGPRQVLVAMGDPVRMSGHLEG